MNPLGILFAFFIFSQDVFIREAEPEKPEELLHRITQHGAVTGLAMAVDGIFAAVGDTLRIWDGINGTPLVALVGSYPGPFQAAAFSPDGTSIVGLSREGEMNGWAVGPLRFKVSFIDRAKSATAGRNKAHFGAHANAVAYSPDGKLVVTAAADSPPLKVWDADTGALVREIAPTGVMEVTALAFSPDGSLLACATLNDLRLMDSSDWTVVRTAGAVAARINAIAFSFDGETMATASDDNTAHLWKTKTGESIAEMKGHTAAVRGVAFSADGDLVASASVDKTVRIWDSAGTLKSTIAHPRPVYAVAFTEAGNELVTASGDNTVRLLRVPDWKVTQRLVALEQDTANMFLYEKDAVPSEESARVIARIPASWLKTATPKAPASELSALATQILRVIQTNQFQELDSLLSGDQFTIDGARLLAGGQPSLQDREGVLARVFDTNRLRSLISKYGLADAPRFKSLREILQAEAATASTEILDRPKENTQEDAATIVIHWKRDPMDYGLWEYPQFAIARIGGKWNIVDVSLPLDVASPSRFTVAQQRVRQLRSFAQQLIRNTPDDSPTLKQIVSDRQSAFAFEIRFVKEAGQWWAPDLDDAEIVFRWDGDPSDYNLKEYPQIRLHLEGGSWKIRP